MNNTPKHTPGPWTEPHKQFAGLPAIYDASGNRQIAIVNRIGNAGECEANASLIASAPELLQQVQDLKTINKQLMQVIRRSVIYLESQVSDEMELNHLLDNHQPEDCVLCELRSVEPARMQRVRGTGRRPRQRDL